MTSRKRTGFIVGIAGFVIAMAAFHVGLYASTWPHHAGSEWMAAATIWAIVGVTVSIFGFGAAADV